MIGWTLCSGIGAPEVAAPWMDWRLASEIEPFPRAVLQDRFGYKLPEDHNQGDPLLWSDMTEVTPALARSRGVPLPDVLVAGTPCQAFSIAGLRGGTEDARGNLTLKFVETCHAIVDARPDGKLAILWENVPGVLSDKGNAFGCFLGGLVGAVDALPRPAGGSWPSEGMVEGPRARAAWCVLDAQWFGVAQRRRRVFVVIDFGNCCDPAQILLEPDSLRGDHPPRREAGQDVAGTLSARTQGGGGLGTDFDLAGGLVPDRVQGHHGAIAGTVSSKWSKGSGGPAGDETQNMVAFDCNGTEVQHDASGGETPLRSMGHNNSHQNAGGHAAVAVSGSTTHALTGEGHDASEDGTGRGTPVVAFDPNQVTCKTNGSVPSPEVCHTIPNKSEPPHLFSPVVRRLMPVECARLQGFPDDHCAITYRGKPAADGPQYKALGNSMAVPCIAWIMNRIKASMEKHT
ncbi:DNA cytosine methyltransferase [Sulfitobacter sp. R18_1]|uniref:DNA cytosine methyltransferase n=1 Tax=Sulfitobacter sp. R18_1 TaxID=2821104 RepID=UPI001ADBAF11|nr:DNA cytosine methyltransferase [Sulfitobacter sp. R18_1]MBO9430596.1 DNA cytosine methyltransferase [Sulfitobacter sp. R18_1]